MKNIRNSSIKHTAIVLVVSAVIYTVTMLIHLYVMRLAMGSCEGDVVCAMPNDFTDMIFRQLIDDLILVSRIVFELGFILFIFQVIRKLLKLNSER